jgi:transposase
MLKKSHTLHLEIQVSRKNPVGVLRTSYYENGKTKHAQHGLIKGKTLNELKLLQLAIRGKVVPSSSEALSITASKEYGASAAIHSIIQRIGLRTDIHSVRHKWVDCVIAMIIGRIIYAGSKLALSYQENNSSLWEVCGISNVDVDRHCYEPMDELLARQYAIERRLAKKHLENGKLVLYDITSSYLEGEYDDSELVQFGYNRDGKRGHEQIVISLICNEDGCPVATEIFPGNTKDSTTVPEVIKRLKESYKIKEAIFVGDRGMITKDNLDAIESDEDLRFITALTRADIRALIEKDVIQLGLFDRQGMGEFSDPGNPEKRYCVCKNEFKALHDQAALDVLLKNTSDDLAKIAAYKQSTTVEILGARIGKVVTKWNTNKYINWRVEQDAKQKDEKQNKSRAHKVIWSLNQKVIDDAKRLAGCYVIASNVKDVTCAEIIKSYKSLMNVERAFKNLKTVKLEIRPVYHKLDNRIKAHVFLCMLAYYVQWHMQQKLSSLTDGVTGKNRQWTFEQVIETMKCLRKSLVSVGGVETTQTSKPTPDQARVLDLLGVSL